jgi:hypothetical protein
MISIPKHKLQWRWIKSLHIFSQNVCKNYALTESILATKKDNFDIIFIQEPPWNLICHVPSTKEPLNDELMGAPIYPEWTYMVHPSDPHLCVMTYVHTRLQVMRPMLRRDLIDSRDIQVLSLQTKDGKTLFLLNVYLDDKFGAIKLLDHLTDFLPLLFYMGGDFNCRSRIWDQFSTHDSFHANMLVEVVSSLGLCLASMPYVPTHFPFFFFFLNQQFIYRCTKVVQSRPKYMSLRSQS